MRHIIIVLCFIVFDVITGYIKALKNQNIDSTYLRKGLYSKLSEILAVIGSYFLNIGSKYINLGVEIPLLQGVAIYLCIMELVSIIENLCAVNPALEKLFGPYLEKIKEQKKEEDKDE